MMKEHIPPTEHSASPEKDEDNWQGVVKDWSADKQTFDMPWGKLMMWIFLLSDTFKIGRASCRERV